MQNIEHEADQCQQPTYCLDSEGTCVPGHEGHPGAELIGCSLQSHSVDCSGTHNQHFCDSVRKLSPKYQNQKSQRVAMETEVITRTLDGLTHGSCTPQARMDLKSGCPSPNSPVVPLLLLPPSGLNSERCYRNKTKQKKKAEKYFYKHTKKVSTLFPLFEI